MSFDFQGFHDESSITTAISRITYQGGPFLLGEDVLSDTNVEWQNITLYPKYVPSFPVILLALNNVLL